MVNPVITQPARMATMLSSKYVVLDVVNLNIF